MHLLVLVPIALLEARIDIHPVWALYPSQRPATASTEHSLVLVTRFCKIMINHGTKSAHQEREVPV